MDAEPEPEPPIAGLVLAAGAGSRYGGPKALARDPDGSSWLVRAVRVLETAGCSPVFVVLGAEAASARTVLASAVASSVFDRRADVRPVEAARWASGMSESVRVGIRAVVEFDPQPEAVVIVPVDVPDLNANAVARVAAGASPSSLRQAQFAGRPGHPVLIGRDHWLPLESGLAGDTGARPYLVEHGAELIDCGDLGTGRDVDVR